MNLRSVSPVWIKKISWAYKSRNANANTYVAPHDLVDSIAPRLTETSRLLDLGCGTGAMLIALRKRGWNGPYTGVDITRNFIEVGKTVGSNATWAVSSIEDFPITPHEVICLSESIYYVHPAKVQRLLERCYEMCTDSFVVRIHDLQRHSDYVSELRRFFGDRLVQENVVFSVRKVPATPVREILESPLRNASIEERWNSSVEQKLAG
jgi:ubiquinone/menaquinone biosynthesis C-methylase UbiE